MSDPRTSLDDLLSQHLGVDTRYRHSAKWVEPRETCDAPRALLKWYHVAPRELPVPAEIERLARTTVSAGAADRSGLGFVVLHRCGRDFYFLIVCTWQHENELWQSVYYKDGEAMAAFAPFPREGLHKPMLCVWELVPVWHEQQAWVRFLSSPRGAGDARRWLEDRLEGSTG